MYQLFQQCAGFRSVERKGQAASVGRWQATGPAGRSVRTRRRFGGGGAQIDSARQRRAHVGPDFGQRSLVAFARRLSDHSADAIHRETARQILPGRLGRE